MSSQDDWISSRLNPQTSEYIHVTIPSEMRRVVEIVPTHTVREGGGFKVRRPSRMNSVQSPFLLIDEMGPVDYGPGEAVGAPWHPHRGFETVTYLLDGRMRHEDSAGNSGELLSLIHI